MDSLNQLKIGQCRKILRVEEGSWGNKRAEDAGKVWRVSKHSYRWNARGTYNRETTRSGKASTYKQAIIMIFACNKGLTVPGIETAMSVVNRSKFNNWSKHNPRFPVNPPVKTKEYDLVKIEDVVAKRSFIDAFDLRAYSIDIERLMGEVVITRWDSIPNNPEILDNGKVIDLEVNK